MGCRVVSAYCSCQQSKVQSQWVVIVCRSRDSIVPRSKRLDTDDSRDATSFPCVILPCVRVRDTHPCILAILHTICMSEARSVGAHSVLCIEIVRLLCDSIATATANTTHCAAFSHEVAANRIGGWGVTKSPEGGKGEGIYRSIAALKPESRRPEKFAFCSAMPHRGLLSGPEKG